MERRPDHRPEIEGLRAVAVLAVLLFHAGFPLPGGYIGVDVFFAISGFLITRNILRDRQAGNFTFGGFYIRRIRRLFPALAVTLLATLAAGWQWLAPDDMARLAESALFAVISLSNVLFWREIGYFDADAVSKPLLHTWSLAVEEQFYLVWPAVVVGASRLRHTWGPSAVIAMVGVSSFLGAEFHRSADPGAVFYLTPFRMFQLSSGALLAVIDPQRARPSVAKLATLAGLCAIAYGVFRFDATTGQERYWALLPCVGAALVIYGGSNSWSTPLLANRVCRGLGAISYSLYLVHWPVIAFDHYLHGPAASTAHKLLMATACLPLAAALYWLVEWPLRSGGAGRRALVGTPAAMTAITAMALLVSAIGVHAWHTGGWPSRMPKELAGLPSETAMWNERNAPARVGRCFVYAPTETRFDDALCLAGELGRPNYLIVGDSFAADAYVYLSAAFPDVNFLQATAGSCHPLVGNVTGDALCKELLHRIFDTFIPRREVDGVILAAAWDPADLDLLEKTIQRLKSSGLRVVLLGSGIRFEAKIRPLIYQSGAASVPDVERFVSSKALPSVVALNATMRRRFTPQVDGYIDVQSILCDGHCRVFTPDGKLIYVDFGHLTLAGSLFLAPKIASRYANLFGPSPHTQ
jgi:peptidoglycan/LPS O-acetylase OafA/YrhL